MPHDAIIADVWNGRNLSENSLPVVINQLRKALDDSDRTLIETVPKRGYRVRSAAREPAPLERSLRRRLLRPTLAAVAAAIVGLMAWQMRGTPRPEISVAEVVNETGDPGLAPHARATSELIVTELSRRGYRVQRDAGADLSLSAKLVTWNHAPWLAITVTDPAGVVRWSAMLPGAPPQVPTTLKAELDKFDRTIGDIEG